MESRTYNQVRPNYSNSSSLHSPERYQPLSFSELPLDKDDLVTQSELWHSRQSDIDGNGVSGRAQSLQHQSLRHSFSYFSMMEEPDSLHTPTNQLPSHTQDNALSSSTPSTAIADGDCIATPVRRSQSNMFYRPQSSTYSECDHSPNQSVSLTSSSSVTRSSSWQVVRKPSKESNVTKYLFVQCKKRHSPENSDSEGAHSLSTSKRNSHVFGENMNGQEGASHVIPSFSHRSTPSLQDISPSELLNMLNYAYDYVLS